MDRFFSHLRHLRDGRPGRRFRDSHRRTRQTRKQKGAAWRIGQGVLGLTLTLAGIFFMAVPGPGIPVLLVGLVLVATVSRRTARLLDRGEMLLRLAWGTGHTAWQSASPLRRGFAVLLAVAGLAAVGFAVLRMAIAVVLIAFFGPDQP